MCVDLLLFEMYLIYQKLTISCTPHTVIDCLKIYYQTLKKKNQNCRVRFEETMRLNLTDKKVSCDFFYSYLKGTLNFIAFRMY